MTSGAKRSLRLLSTHLSCLDGVTMRRLNTLYGTPTEVS